MPWVESGVLAHKTCMLALLAVSSASDKAYLKWHKKCEVLFHFRLLGHTQQCSRFNSDCVLRGHSWWCSGNHMWYWDWTEAGVYKASVSVPVLSLQSRMQFLFVYLFVFGLGTTPSNAHCLLLVLYSGITHGGAQGTIWNAGIKPGLAVCEARTLPTVLSLRP